MAKYTVIGSGASGVHFALSCLERGHTVEMIDVGLEAPPTVQPDATFAGLKSGLKDPAGYFLGENFDGVLFPDDGKEYYGFPPSKEYAYRGVTGTSHTSGKFEPLFSYARGGLAEMWTAGCYPFNDPELEEFPFGFEDISRYYVQVAKRIGINGVADDLSAFIPMHEELMEPLRLDGHSSLLLSRYQSQRELLASRYKVYMGRARHAVLSRDRGLRHQCQYTGRCLWGCPSGALYTPVMTLEECMKHERFSYYSGRYVTHFRFNDSGVVESLYGETLEGGVAQEIPVENLVLAAGALGTSRIVLESVYRKTGKIIRLKGLMDNRQILVPFLNLGMFGRDYDPDSYQYNQLAMGLKESNPREYIHCLITTLKTSMAHPIIEKLPLDLKSALSVFRNLHAALGLVNVNFHDTRRDDNYITLDVIDGSEKTRLKIQYNARDNESRKIRETLKRLKKVLWKLGCVVPPGMIHVRPMGAGVHYAGTIPMSHTKKPWTVTQTCRSHDFRNVHIVDGATYPFLPAKNITFTLMANAMRVADLLEHG